MNKLVHAIFGACRAYSAAGEQSAELQVALEKVQQGLQADRQMHQSIATALAATDDNEAQPQLAPASAYKQSMSLPDSGAAAAHLPFQ